MLLLTGLGSCTATSTAPLSRDLPSRPAFAQPVRTADMRTGESCWVAYDRKRSGERQNASIVVRYNRWYEDVRKNYSAK